MSLPLLDLATPQPAPNVATARSQHDQRGVVSMSHLALAAVLLLAVMLLAYYAWFIWPFVSLPADILMWSETNFVGDIIKLRTGVPLYTPPEDSNSLIYTPAAPLVTYAVAWLAGAPTSIAAFRVIQLGFVACAALLATLCWRLLYRLSYPDEPMRHCWTWTAVTFLALTLTATAPEVNRYVHCLHTDALALLVSIVSFLSVLLYLHKPSWARLLVMAACPALGYLTKQFLVSWAAILFLFLLLDRPRDWKRLVVFFVATTLFIGVAVGACLLLWGDAFRFWTFELMGGERSRVSFWPGGMNISVPRMLDHFVRVWPAIALGVIGGWFVLRHPTGRRLWPAWCAWLVLIASEAYSSGAGWSVLYHFGPGVMIGVIWLFAALPRLWPRPPVAGASWADYLARCAVGTVALATAFLMLGVVPSADPNSLRFWGRRPPADTYRYLADVEAEFAGLPPESVLLDVGNWVYLPNGVLMKDRAVSLGDQPVVGIYSNFEVMRERVEQRAYAKILVRDLHAPNFLYDWDGWPRPSGIRAALLANYDEVRTIPAVAGNPNLLSGVRHTGPVSVFVPKASSTLPLKD